MKICPKCSLSKNLKDFYKCAKNKDGLQSYCKTCLKEANTKWSKDNPDRMKELGASFNLKPKRVEYLRNYKELNREHLLIKGRLYKENNKEKTDAANKLYRSANKERVLEAARKYRESNRAKVRESSKNYRSKNAHKYARYSSVRRSYKSKAQPPWLSKDDQIRMDLMWGLRDLKSFVTGVEYEVDHIVPLNSSLVCGLHVPWNLRVIEKTLNRSKGNRHWEDMWLETTILTECDT